MCFYTLIYTQGVYESGGKHVFSGGVIVACLDPCLSLSARAPNLERWPFSMDLKVTPNVHNWLSHINNSQHHDSD